VQLAPGQDRPATRRLVQVDPVQLRQRVPHLLTCPEGQARGVRVRGPFELVQRVVIQLLEHRREDLLHVPVVDGPAHHLVERRGQVQAQREGVTVDAPARVPVRGALQTHGTVEREFLPDAVVQPIVAATGRGRLVDGDPGEFGHLRLQPLPDPARDDLAGGVLEPGNVVQTGVVQFRMDWGPALLEVVEVDPHVALPEVLVGVQDDLEPVPVHAPAFVARVHVRQLVRSLEAEPAPDVDVSIAVDVRTLVGCAQHAHSLQPRHIQMPPNPARDVLVGGDRDVLVQKTIVETMDAVSELLLERLRLGTGERCPVRRQGGTDAGVETMPMQAAGTVPVRQYRDLAGGFERRGSGVEDSIGRHVGSPNLR
jgi:hypothetical protein